MRGWGQRRLGRSRGVCDYETVRDLEADIALIVVGCFKFNGGLDVAASEYDDVEDAEAGDVTAPKPAAGCLGKAFKIGVFAVCARRAAGRSFTRRAQARPLPPCALPRGQRVLLRCWNGPYRSQRGPCG